MSSKPTTATSSGTRTPAAAKARRTPIAIWSLAHTTASGSAPRYRMSSFSPACSPLRTLKIPCVEPISSPCGWPRRMCSRASRRWIRSEEHTSELQSHHDLVCRLLLEKKKKKIFEHKLKKKNKPTVNQNIKNKQK